MDVPTLDRCIEEVKDEELKAFLRMLFQQSDAQAAYVIVALFRYSFYVWTDGMNYKEKGGEMTH